MPIYKGNTKIVKLYKGATEIVRRYKGTNLIYQNSLLPTGYIRLDYIENPDQNAYIDTGILPDDTSGFKVQMSVRDITTDLYYLGCRESNQTDSRFGLGVYDGHIYMALGTYYSDVNNWTITRNTPFVAENNYKNSRVATMNGLNPVSVGTLSGITFTRKIYLFKSNQSTTQMTSNCRIYDCEITKGTSVVAHFIPCLDNNGVPCMYDVLTQQTYYNAGTGQFEYGLPIPSNYTELSYIESTGTQFIDTGFTPNQNTKVELTIQKDPTTAGAVFGSRVSNQSRAFTFQIASGDKKFLSGYSAGTETSNIVNDGQVHTLMRDKSDFYVDGVLKVSQTRPDFTCPANAYLFTMYNNATPTTSTSVKIYGCKIWDNGIIHNYFVPCLDTNNVPCMFDRITGNTYYNDGTGTFDYA